MSLPSLSNGLGEEHVPPGEDAAIESILAIHRDVQEHFDRPQKPTPRGQHPKQHGCVVAKFIVEPDLPPDLRYGVLREGGEFLAVVRFSNARQKNDLLPDAHGMAIKLFEVPGARLLEEDAEARTQDFVLIDHPMFFLRNVADGVPLMQDFRRLMIGSVSERISVLARGALSLDYRYRLIRTIGRKLVANPLRIQYWSTTPIRFGPAAIKLSLVPQLAREPRTPVPFSRDRLQLALAEHLRQRDAYFDVCVQLQADPIATPIEDPTVPWPEELSPWRKAATLRILRQEVVDQARLRFGENLSFTPWHGVEDHRPLGGINRARRRVYEIMAARRRELNGASLREPSAEDVRALWPDVAAVGR